MLNDILQGLVRGQSEFTLDLLLGLLLTVKRVAMIVEDVNISAPRIRLLLI